MIDISEQEILTIDKTDLSWNVWNINPNSGLYNVCYGNGKIIIVGGYGLICTSSDGVTWTFQKNVLEYGIQAVCYGNGIFVAVGSDYYIAYSSDGINWSKSLTSSSYYNDICYRNGIFVAVSGNGYICTSSDGITWTKCQPGNISPYYTKINYLEGVFIAVASSGVVMTSMDCINWSRVMVGTSNYFYQMRLCNDKIIITGSSGYLMISDDGLNWTLTKLELTNDIRDVCYYNGLYVAVGGGVVLTSTDTINWTKQTVGNTNYLYTVCCGDGVFVTTDNNGYIYTSEDGVVWYQYGTSYGNSFLFSEYINGMFIIGGYSGSAVTSGVLGEPIDEITNTRPTITTSVIHNANIKKTVGDSVLVSWDASIDVEGDAIFYDLCFYNGNNWNVIARGLTENSYNHIIPNNCFNTIDAKYKVRSGDGDLYNNFVESNEFTIYGALKKYIWQIMERVVSDTLRNIIYNDGLYIAVGSNGVILTSTDTITWTKRVSGITDTIYYVAYGNGLYVAVGGRTILTSSNGINWTKASVSEYIYGVTYGNGVFVICGYSGSSGIILTSANGINWTSQKLISYGYFYDIFYLNDKFITTYYGNIYISYDGVSWITTSCNYSLKHLTYGKGMYVGITESGTVVTSADCNVWTQRAILPSGMYFGIMYTGNLFIALLNNGSISTSKDGIIWNTQLCPDSLLKCCYNDGLLVGVGVNGTIRTSNIILNEEITPISITHNATTRKLLNDSVVINWVDADDIDGYVIDYNLYFYNGVSWLLLEKNISGNTYTHVITDVIDNTNIAKYKVIANNTPTGEVSNHIESDTFEILINAVPEAVTFINHNVISKKTTKGVIEVTWDSGYDELGDTLIYELSFYNGANWEILKTLSGLNYTHTLSYVLNTTDAKYRVRAYDGRYYSEYLESSVFETYINTAPSINSITHNATTKKRIGDKVTVNWSEAIDIDNDNITYDLYFYNGDKWIQLLKDTTVTTYTHTIPQLTYNTSISRYKVIAYDGIDYGSFIESSAFEIYDAYDLIPIVTTENKDLGKLEKVPYFSYKVNDNNKNENLSVSIYLDRYMLDFVDGVERGKIYSVDFADMWDSLSNEKHTLKISAYDGTEYTKKMYNFTKIIYQPPTISGYNTNLGYQDSSFVQSYVVKDEYENTPLTVIESIDDTIFNTITSALRDNTYNIDLSSVWDSLSIGLHKIEIKVIDRFENGETRTFNFYKKEQEEENTSVDGNDMYLGVKYSPFYCNFVVDDSNSNDKINVNVYLNNEIIDQTYNAIRGFKYNIGINSKLFNKLESNATHTIQIVASDGVAITTKNYMFKKKDLLEEYIILDVKFESILPTIECKKNNNLALKFKIQYLGEDINLVNYKVTFKALKPNGDIFVSNDVTKNNNGNMSVLCNSKLNDIEGIVKCQIQLTDKDGRQKNTQSFNLHVINI